MPAVERSRSRVPVVVGLLALIGLGLWWLRGDEAPGAPAPADATGTAARDGGRTSFGDGPRSRPELDLDIRRGERASISGTITDEKGRPISGANVCAAARSEQLASSDTRRVTCAVSGKDGHYRIGDLFGVRHVVMASAPTFIPDAYHHGEGVARRDTVDLRPAFAATGIDIMLRGGGVQIHGVVKDLSGGAIEGAQVGARSSYAITSTDGAFSLWVRPGDATVEATADGYADGYVGGAAPGHFFEVFLTPESVLIGKVVRVGDGSPVENARVTAQTGGWGWNQAATFTDEGGNFRLAGLKPGPYKARAEADDAMGLAEEQAILGLGETSEPILIKAHPAFMVEADVVISGGGACDEGWISLEDKKNARGSSGQPNSDGEIKLRGLLPGDYEVGVHCSGYVSAERYEHVIIADKSLSGLKWEVTRGLAIRGEVVDGSGKPVERVSVSASPKPDPSQPRAHQTSTWGGETDVSGKFELSGLLPGAYNIEVNSWEPPQRSTLPKPMVVTVAKDQDLEGLRIELPATGEISGSVRDQKGQPVPRASISLSSGIDWQSTMAADDGNFRFAHVAAGEYRLVARKGWDVMQAPGTSEDDVQGEKVEVKAGSRETVKLVVESRDGKITGIVRDADGGPVADAFIEASRESESATASTGGAMRDGRWSSYFDTPKLTDPDGRFALSDLPDGKHTLRAHRKGGGEAIVEHVGLGDDVVLTIASAGRLAGTVGLRGGGAAPEEFTVNVEDELTGFSRNDNFFRTGGAWSLAEVPAGKYKIRVSAGAGSAEAEAVMTAGKDTTGVRIELAPKVTVRGKVLNLEGEPVPGLRVMIAARGSWSFGGNEEDKQNITDAAGNFEVPLAPTGAVQVTLMPRNWNDEEYGWSSMPAKIEANDAGVDLPPIRVARKRVKEGEVGGDLGYKLKEDEPGADPLTTKLIVAFVRPGGPAATGGLQVGDEITSVDGQDVTGPNQYLHGSLTRVLSGTPVTLGLARGASLQLTAGKRP